MSKRERKISMETYMVRVYAANLSQEMDFVSIEAEKITPASEIVDSVCKKLNLRPRMYELAEIFHTGEQICKERRLQPAENPVQIQLVWPKVNASKYCKSQTTGYRFYISKKEPLEEPGKWKEYKVPNPIDNYLGMFIRKQSEVKEYTDLCSLPDLNEKTLLENLKSRFNNGSIYTYVGSILIAVNPFKFFPIYNPKYVKMYQNSKLGDLPPHIFAIADSAFHTMLREKRNQCIVISGESGSGKTESTNLLLHHLTAISQKGLYGSGVEQTILVSGHVLEAFGNAKTVHNNNSSRFGKYIQVNYKENGMVHGAIVEKYLLEKTRIVSQDTNERNYHVFYYLLAGASEQDRYNLCLADAENFHYLNQSNCYTLDVDGELCDEAHEFERLKQSMEIVGFSVETQRRLFAVLSAVLHIGNIEFKKKSDRYHHDAVEIRNPDVLKVISNLLRVKETTLKEALTTKKTTAGGESVIINYKMEEAVCTRDAMAKCLYGALFEWIVLQINQALISKKDMKEHQGHSIGVLDIFGFEDFQKNSYEQFCINYANEHLQFYFNQHIFRFEQDEYQRENIEWKNIDFIDNTGCLELFSAKPKGLFSLLDEECNFPGATNDTLLEKFHHQHKNNPYYEVPPVRESVFTIVHYAGKIKYMVKDFREKNSDLMRPDVVLVVKNSSLAFVRELVGSDPVAVLRWAIVRAFFRCYFAFLDAGKRHKEQKAARGNQQGAQVNRRHSWINNRAENTAGTSSPDGSFSTPPLRSSGSPIAKRNTLTRHSFTSLPVSSTSPISSPSTSPTVDEVVSRWELGNKQHDRQNNKYKYNFDTKAVMKNKSFKPKSRPTKGLRDIRALKSVAGQRMLGKKSIPSKKQHPSVGAQFQYSLGSLMENLENANPLFVRCIKSNSHKAPCQFDDEIILRQLRYTGMLATVEIRRSGYNYRLTFDEFIQNYEILLPNGRLSSKVDVQNFFENLDLNTENFQLGKTKVFLREREKILIDTALHNAILKRVILIQRWMKTHFERQNFIRLKSAVIKIQSHFRRFVAQQRLMRLYAAIMIQQWYRNYRLRKARLARLKVAAVNIQRWYRGYIARKRYVELLADEMKRRLEIRKHIEEQEKLELELAELVARQKEVDDEILRQQSLEELTREEKHNREIADEDFYKENFAQMRQPSNVHLEKHSSFSDEGILLKESSIEELDVDLERDSIHTNDSEESSGILDDVSDYHHRSRSSGMTPPPASYLELVDDAPKINPLLVTFMSDDTVPSPVIKRARGSSIEKEDLRPKVPPRSTKPNTFITKSLSDGSMLHGAGTDVTRVGIRRMVAPLAKQESISDSQADKLRKAKEKLENRQVEESSHHDESDENDVPGWRFRRELESVLERAQHDQPDLLNLSVDSANIPHNAGHRSALHRVKDRVKNIMGGNSSWFSVYNQLKKIRHSLVKWRKGKKYEENVEETASTPQKRAQDLGVAVLPTIFPPPHSPTKRISSHESHSSNNDLDDNSGEFKENKKPKKRQGSRKSREKDEHDQKTNWNKTGTQQWQYSNKLYIRDIDELEELDKFIFTKLVKISQDCGRSDSVFDTVFKASLKDFHCNTLINLKSLAMQETNSQGVKYRELMLNFEQVLLKNLQSEHNVDLDSFPTTLATNAFRGFMDEFLKKRDQKRMEKDKPERKKKEKKKRKEEDNYEHLRHRFIVVQFTIPTFCEVCNNLVWTIKDKGMSCQICKFTCHKKCLQRLFTPCNLEVVTGVFGAPLLSLLSETNKIPVVVERLIAAIEINGLYTEGIYRKAGAALKIKQLKKQINEDVEVSFDLDEYPIHVLASLLKTYFRELPEPLLTFELYDDFIRATDTGDFLEKEKVQSIFTVIEKLPAPNHDLFERLVYHLARVAHCQSSNKMNASNLSVVFSPCILRTNRPLPAQESLSHVAKQAITIEMVISEQLRKLKGTLSDLNALDSDTVTASQKLNNIQNNRKSQPQCTTSPRLRRVATDINEKLIAVDEEEKAISKHLETIQREKDELTSNLPVLECRQGSSDEDMLSESEDEFPVTFTSSPALPPTQLPHIPRKCLAMHQKYTPILLSPGKLMRSLSNDNTIVETEDDELTDSRSSASFSNLSRRGSYEAEDAYDVCRTIKFTLDSRDGNDEDDENDEIMV